MKRFFVFMIVCLAVIFATAQEIRELQQVKLKSGMTISGYVTNNADGSISVTTIEGDNLLYRSDEVETISEKQSVVKEKKEAKKDSGKKAAGFFISVSAIVIIILCAA